VGDGVRTKGDGEGGDEEGDGDFGDMEDGDLWSLGELQGRERGRPEVRGAPEEEGWGGLEDGRSALGGLPGFALLERRPWCDDGRRTGAASSKLVMRGRWPPEVGLQPADAACNGCDDGVLPPPMDCSNERLKDCSA